MKQGVKPPSTGELVKVYNKFQSGSASLDDLIEHFEWVRFDPRLGEILIKYIEQHWSEWNPMHVHRMITKKEWPTVFAVLCEHVLMLLTGSIKSEFSGWLQCATANLAHPSPQLFFIGLYSFGGKLARNEALNTLKIYRRWGFYSSHLMIRKTSLSRTLLKKNQRKLLLRELLNQKPRLTVKDYILHLGGHVSRRVAELDLKATLKKRGKTRGATYR